MRKPLITKTALAASLVSALCCAVATAGAWAGTGGASAPSSSPAPHTAHKGTIATWFGPGFYGQKTACGQTLTPAVVGVANRTLPCGTLVKVSYHGRRLVVPVIDRGPYAHNGAEWDLTTGAAQALGIEDTVRVGTRVVGATPNTPTLGLPLGAPPATTLTGGASAAP
jgi:rare lipoprotein A